MNAIQLPKIAVLLAAYNGEKYIEQQIASILSQECVHVDIFISLDKSTDKTIDILKAIQKKTSRLTIFSHDICFGSAGKNFYHLLENFNEKNYDFVALADQDDLWHAEKLNRAATILMQQQADGYSSDITAYWPQTQNRAYIKKSQPQRKYDYLFESAGPGCTYVLTSEFFEEIQKFIVQKRNEINAIEAHDWLIYAYARTHQKKWIIDHQSHMLYTQHTANVVGANKGLTAKIRRFHKIANGEWITQVQRIYNATKNEKSEFLKNILNQENIDYFILSKHSRELRRKYTESLFLKFLFFYFYLFKK